MATRCIEENVKKARGAFFKLGSIGAFQGDLNPLSTKSVIVTCVSCMDGRIGFYLRITWLK